ncbi:hypothetical protein VTL71DRAFT_9270 [Oculimacula yallundae]|uniref:Uncharacterized protein n=1 Tax=Oculimacula yallundae TaxID=86028 RepID=A0ABR4BSJ7_9HELO
MFSLKVLVLCSSIALATARDVIGLQARDAGIFKRAVSIDGVCGGYNNTNTCTGSGFGTCCSLFGYCGTDDAHCGYGCQSGYGNCVTKQPAVTWASIGCYTDSGASRTLRTAANVGGNTVEICTAACAAAGFSLAGMEFGSQCFCDNAISGAGVLADPATCNKACPGNPLEICGGGDRLSVYKVTPTWQTVGCYTDTTNARTLSASYNIAGNTNEKCQAACQAGGFKYSGTEFGNQCFCGNSIAPTGQVTGDCLTPCQGDATSKCGGINRLSLNVYM